jgi:hypothetical protein
VKPKTVCISLSSTASDVLCDDAKTAAKLEADCDPSTIMEQVHREPCTWEQFKEFEARFVKPLLEAASLSELWLQHNACSARVTAVVATAAAAAPAATATAPEDIQQQQLHMTAAICLFNVQAGQVVLESSQRCCSKSCAHLNNSDCYCNSNKHSCSTNWLRGWWLQLVRCACSHLPAAAQQAGSTDACKHGLEAVLHIRIDPASATCCEAVYIAAIAGTQLCVVAALPAAAVIAAGGSLITNDAYCTAACRALHDALPALQASFVARGVGNATHLTAHDAAVLQPELRAQLQAVCARVEHAFPSHDVLQQLASSGRVPSPFQLQLVAPAAPQQIRTKKQQQPYVQKGRTLKSSTTALQISAAETKRACIAGYTPTFTVERLIAENAVKRITEAALQAAATRYCCCYPL